jgi:hypothetical protein
MERGRWAGVLTHAATFPYNNHNRYSLKLRRAEEEEEEEEEEMSAPGIVCLRRQSNF